MSSSPALTVGAPASDEVVVRVRELGKCYQIYDKPHHRLWQGVWRGRRQFFREFWALRDVTFDVRRGETFGIVGRNGSGKSTLLQLVCGTMSPTTGTVALGARVAALLELGAGFNPEFTGRENVYMNGLLMGMSRDTIDTRFDDVAAFADIGDFLDQPVKTYSSGMFVRLAFSVVANLDPEVLIVDEALAVGDMFFQAKCMLRLDALRDAGTTVIFVSHDTGAVRALCQRCLLLDHGQVRMLGDAATVMDAYVGNLHGEANKVLAMAAADDACTTPGVARLESISDEGVDGSLPMVDIAVSLTGESDLPSTANRYGTGGARILDIKVLDGKGDQCDEIEAGAPFRIQASVRYDRDMPAVVIGYSIRDLKGQMVVGGSCTNEGVSLPPGQAGDVYVYEVSGLNRLLPGVYTVSFGVEIPVLLNRQHVFVDVLEHCAVFRSRHSTDAAGIFHTLVYVPMDYRFARARATHATKAEIADVAPR